MVGLLAPALAIWAAAVASSSASEMMLSPEFLLGGDDWGTQLSAAADSEPRTVPPPQPRGVKLPETDEDDRRTYTLQPGRYYFVSPGFPGPYPNNARRDYTLRGAQGQAIQVWCPRFSLRFDRGCRRDYLAINGRRYCGNRGRLPVTSATSLSIIFRSDGSGRGRGFFCRVFVPTAGAGTTAATTAATTASPSARCCGVVNRRTRIVGGVETQVNEYPWMAGLVRRGGTRTYCGGSVINNRYVLSAAHCTVINNRYVLSA